MRTLNVGTSGEDVARVQRKLVEHGFPPGAIDSSFGPGTQAAVRAFQLSEGLVADGVVGPNTAAALGLEDRPQTVSAIPAVTVEIVSSMFPATPVRNIEANLPIVLDALVPPQLVGKEMVLMALATIRAETESFLPISEGQSMFNTSPGGAPFDLYDNRKDLGNQGTPDGARYKGRGFIQLTGRSNYAEHGMRIGVGNQLIDNPDMANDPTIAAQLLASFLKNKEVAIHNALIENDLKTARRLVNGGSNGLDRFVDAFSIGQQRIPEELSAFAVRGS
jgi:putative chitinase